MGDSAEIEKQVLTFVKELKKFDQIVNLIGKPKKDNRTLRADIVSQKEKTKSLEAHIKKLLSQYSADEAKKRKLQRQLEELVQKRKETLKTIDAKEREFPTSALPEEVPEQPSQKGSPAGKGKGSSYANSAAEQDDHQQQQQQQDVQQIQVDFRPLQVEKAIQEEKLEALKDIETDLEQLHAAAHDLNSLVHEADAGIEQIGNDIVGANEAVENATEQVRGARKKQKGCVVM